MKTRHHPTSRAERGIVLIVVMVMLLLTTFVLLTSNRVGWLNEKLVSSESDHERAFAAAEALIRDAELDISGRRFDGTPCPVNPATHFGCRNLNAPYFPEGDDDLDVIKTRVATGFNKTCSQGICLPGTSVELEAAGAWTTQLAAMQAAGATYGQFTSAKPAAAGNALLTAGRAWYWVEVFRYSTSYGAGAASSAPVPVAQHPYVYRITAFVQGAKPGTQVRLRSTFVPFLARDFQ